MNSLNKKKLYGSITVLSALVAILLGFQNCGLKNKFSVKDSGNGDVEIQILGDGKPALTCNNNNVEVTNDSNLVEIDGRCSTHGGEIVANGDVIGESAAICQSESFDDLIQDDNNNDTDGYFRICLLAPEFGNNTVTITQTNQVGSKYEIQVPYYVTYPVTYIYNFDIINIVVNTSTQATLTIRCVPGSDIVATIYGQPVTTGTITCTAEGTVTFTVTLVASFAGTGQRVVTIKQTTQAGVVTYIFEDVDNVNKTHTCEIKAGIANTKICADSAGTVSGSCKPGSPVKIYVNEVYQQAVTCDQNGVFTAKNVLLTDHANNKIKIVQKTPFETDVQACSDEVIVDEIAEIGQQL